MTEWFMKMSKGKYKNPFILDIKGQNVQIGRYLTRKLARKTGRVGVGIASICVCVLKGGAMHA